MSSRVATSTVVLINIGVFLTAIGVISVAGWLPQPIGIACLSLVACFVRPQWKAGL